MDALASMLLAKLCTDSASLEKQALVAMHNEAAQGLKMLSGMGWQPQTVADSETRHSSSASLASLRRIAIRDLKPGKRHRGRVLLGRLCVRAFKICSFIQTVLEEDGTEGGKAITLKIRHAVSSSAEDGHEELLYPEGMKVAIKEPYFMKFPGGFIGLRIDDPADIMTEKPDPSRSLKSEGPLELQASDILRKEGNLFFSRKDWNKAIELYSKCIEEVRVNARAIQEAAESRAEAYRERVEGTPKPGTPTKGKSKKARSRQKKRLIKCEAAANEIKEDFEAAGIVLLTAAFSNRAEAWLRLKDHENALSDAVTALKLTPGHDKSILRKGKALHGLQCYKQAIRCYQEMLDLSSNKLTTETREQIKGILIREAQVGEIQCRLGIYNLDEYFLGGFKRDPPACADYVGPVEVRHVDQTIGRGLFVTKDVREGELLLVCNPLAVARGNRVGSGHAFGEVSECDAAVMHDLTSQLREVATKNPHKLQQLYALSDGYKARKFQVPAMSIFTPAPSVLICMPEKGETCSGFWTTDLLVRDEDLGELQIDNARIRRIVDANVFEGSRFASSPILNLVWVPETETPTGMWVLPSFINHSCIPNSSRRHVGEAMFVNASRDLRAGEEVTIAYFHLFIPGHERRALFEKRGFVCCCPRCALEQSLSSRAPALRRVSQRYVKYSALTDAVGTLCASAKGASLRRDLNQFLESNQLQLTPENKNWIRASYIRPYLQAIVQVLHNRRVTGVKTPISTQSLDMVFDAMISVHPGSEDTLSMLCLPFAYGTAEVSPSKSKVWADLALRICRCVYGSFKESTGEAILKYHTESSLRYMENQVASQVDTLRFEWCCAVK